MNIIIADDHDLVREALATLIIRDDPKAHVIQTDSLSPVWEHLDSQPVDLLLLDVHMPGMEDLKVIHEITRQYPAIPVVMMSGTVDKAVINTCYDQGASGFIPKTMNGNALVAVLKMVISGVKYVPDMMLKDEDLTDRNDVEELTQREQQVLDLLLEGKSNKAIASQLFIEQTTVKMHLRSLFKKFAATNRTDLVIKALKSSS